MTTLIVIPRSGFWDEELIDVVETLKNSEELYVATIDKENAFGKMGCKVIPDYSIRELLLRPDRPFKNLIIIADEGWKRLYDVDVKTLIAGFLHKDKRVFAFSLAPILLAKFGYLKGKKATFNFFEFPEYEKILKKYYVTFVKTPIVVEKNIVTCVGRMYVREALENIEKIEEVCKKHREGVYFV